MAQPAALPFAGETNENRSEDSETVSSEIDDPFVQEVVDSGDVHSNPIAYSTVRNQFFCSRDTPHAYLTQGVVAQIRPKMGMLFTCCVCETRQLRSFSRCGCVRTVLEQRIMARCKQISGSEALRLPCTPSKGRRRRHGLHSQLHDTMCVHRASGARGGCCGTARAHGLWRGARRQAYERGIVIVTCKVPPLPPPPPLARPAGNGAAAGACPQQAPPGPSPQATHTRCGA